MTEKHHGAMRTTPIAIVVAIAVVVAMVGLWGWSQLGGGPDPQPGPNPTASPTASPAPTTDPKLPETLLWQVRNDELVAVDNLLIGSPTDKSQTALVYIPGGLLVGAGPAGEIT